MKKSSYLKKLLFIRSCKGLFGAVLLYYLISPYLDSVPYLQSNLVQAIFYTFILLTGINAVRRSKRQIVIALVLALPTLGLTWANVGVEYYYVKLFQFISIISFIWFTAGSILLYVLSPGKVDSEKIFGALSIYFLIGHAWAVTFVLIEFIHPGSFYNIPSISEGAGPEFIYFSFVTLTTLGYGDITPVTLQARSLAAFEAIMGVLYIATLVARLVGLYGGSEALKSKGRG